MLLKYFMIDSGLVILLGFSNFNMKSSNLGFFFDGAAMATVYAVNAAW